MFQSLQLNNFPVVDELISNVSNSSIKGASQRGQTSPNVESAQKPWQFIRLNDQNTLLSRPSCKALLSVPSMHAISMHP